MYVCVYFEITDTLQKFCHEDTNLSNLVYNYKYIQWYKRGDMYNMKYRCRIKMK